MVAAVSSSFLAENMYPDAGKYYNICCLILAKILGTGIVQDITGI
jgi:hypothetical protein